jgi:high-affinity nickel-transport protein
VIELLGERLRLEGPVWSRIAAFDLGDAGCVVVGLFVATWAVAVAIWSYGRNPPEKGDGFIRG